MDVGLTAEQLSLRDTVRDILRTECPPDAARQVITDPERWRTLWKTVVDLGWTELAAPDAGDYGPVELAVVLEECGAAIAPIPLLSSIGLAAGVLRVAGAAVGEVLDTMRMLSSEGMTMVVVTHEIRFARDVSDRVAFFHKGRIHEIGPPDRVIGNPQLPETADFLKSVR